MRSTFSTVSQTDSYPASTLLTGATNPADCIDNTTYNATASSCRNRPVASAKWRAGFRQQPLPAGQQRPQEQLIHSEADQHQNYHTLARMVFNSLNACGAGVVNVHDLLSIVATVKNTNIMCLQAANAVLMRLTSVSSAVVTLAQFLSIMASCQQADQGESMTSLLKSLLLHQQSLSTQSQYEEQSTSGSDLARQAAKMQFAPQLSAQIVLSSSLFSSSECSSSDCSSQRSSFDVPGSVSRMQCSSSASTMSTSNSSSKRSSMENECEADIMRRSAYDTLTAAKVRLHGLSRKHNGGKLRRKSLNASLKSQQTTQQAVVMQQPTLHLESAGSSSLASCSTDVASTEQADVLTALLSPATCSEPVSWPLSSTPSESSQTLDFAPGSETQDTSDFLADKLRYEDSICHMSMEALAFAPLPSPRQDGNFLDSNAILELPLVQTLLLEHTSHLYYL